MHEKEPLSLLYKGSCDVAPVTVLLSHCGHKGMCLNKETHQLRTQDARTVTETSVYV